MTAKSKEILTSFRTIRSFDAEMREYKIYKDKLKDVQEINSKTAFVSGLREVLSTILTWGMNAGVLWLCGKQVINHEIDAGDVIVIFTIVNNWAGSFSGIFGNVTDLKKSNVSTAKIMEIIERKPGIIHNKGRTVAHIRGRIEFRDVKFRYQSRDEYALNGISFVIEPGEMVALVGESGCGKSTTLLLIQRFYECTEGEILVDGRAITKIQPQSLRSHIALVPQHPVMFSMTAKDNIRFSKIDASQEEIIEAANIANAHSFLCQLVNGYNTFVHQNTLSGGQKQRICIARAVLMDAPIMLLDEATASLDAESESLVQEALQQAGRGRTIVVVAHRLATVRNATRIMVMDKGKIAEVGNHNELIEKNGIYAKLVQSQLQ